MHFAKEVGESMTLKFAQAAAELKAQGREIISLGLGEPDFETPKYVVDATIEALKSGYTHYSATQGLPELRKYIAEKATEDYGVRYGSNEVIVLPGIKACLYMALSSLLEPFDKVVCLSPGYVSYPALVKLAEPRAEMVNVMLGRDFSLNMDEFRKAVNKKTKCIILNSPHNPTGKTLSKKEVEEIIRICLENDVYIISDDAYEKMVFSNSDYVNFASYPEIKERLIITNGYSKPYAMTGWRIGYAIGPENIIARMNKMQQHINTNTCTFIQKGACAIYENKETHLAPYVKELERRAKYMHEALTEGRLIKGVMPEGGFFYFADISATGMDSNSFCAELLKKTGVACNPGIAFGQEWDDHVRFCFAIQSETLERAIGLIKGFEKEYGK
ncbi:MAG: pyridoxal phosphate-dependent aminotransferase [Clostridiaceae bacterium]